MSYITIIRCPLGVGKSTVAKMLAKKINAAYFSIDTILAELGLDVSDKALGCIAPSQFIQAQEHIFPSIRQYLSRESKVVLDGNYYHKEQIDHVLSHFPNTYIFTLTASLAICVERDKHSTHPLGEGAATAVYTLVSRVSAGTGIETSNQSPKQTLHSILHRNPFK